MEAGARAILAIGSGTFHLVSAAIQDRKLRQQDRARLLAELEERLVTAHEVEFAPATEPKMTPPPRLGAEEMGEIQRRYSEMAYDGQSRLALIKRYKAGVWARNEARKEIAAANHVLDIRHREEFDFQSRTWPGLVAGDAETTTEVLTHVFEDNLIPVASVQSDGNHAAVILLFGTPDDLPDKAPRREASGEWALEKRGADDRAKLYIQSLASNVIATLDEAFACTVALRTIDLLAVSSRTGRVRRDRLEPLCLMSVERGEAEAHSDNGDPLSILTAYKDVEIDLDRSTHRLRQLDLSENEEAAQALDDLRRHLRH